MFLDTNTASRFCDARATPEGGAISISSVVASELLRVYDEKPTSARYYVPLPARISSVEAESGKTYVGSNASLRRRDHPFGKRTTDSIVMQFGAIHRPIVEFGSQALSNVINQGRAELFATTVRHLPKAHRKVARRRYTWLLEVNATCVPISDDVLVTAYAMLRMFSRSHNCKTAFRNTWNDMLIAATAWVGREVLHSEDKLLNRFLASVSGAQITQLTGTLLADYSATQQEASRDLAPKLNRGFHRPWRHRLAGGQWARSKVRS